MDDLHEDAGEYKEAIQSMLARIPKGWDPYIRCDAGWYPILARLHARLVDMDPDYKIYQIKEKFGGLRFYWSGETDGKGREAVAEAEEEAWRTCEMCGSPGELHVRRGWYRTLCEDHAQEFGYEPFPADYHEGFEG